MVNICLNAGIHFPIKYCLDLEKPILPKMPCLKQRQIEFDKPGFLVTILMYLSKTYHYLPQELIIVEFEAYRIIKSRLKLLLDYLILHKRSVKRDCSYSLWNDIMRSAPQGSIQDLYYLMVSLTLFACLSRTVKFENSRFVTKY